MNVEYVDGSMKNVFEHLDDKSSRCLLGLCLAANDLIHCHEELETRRAGERMFFFAVALSILREAAKVIETYEKTELRSRCSTETLKLFGKLKEELRFNDDSSSLTKPILKTIRDVTFHYDFEQTENMTAAIEELRSEKKLPVRQRENYSGLFRHRYKFADVVRSKLVNHPLTVEIVNQLTEVTLNIVRATYSLLADLSES